MAKQMTWGMMHVELTGVAGRILIFLPPPIPPICPLRPVSALAPPKATAPFYFEENQGTGKARICPEPDTRTSGPKSSGPQEGGWAQNTNP